MARRTPPPSEPVADQIVDIDITTEMQGSFLEYAYSVIYSRALPDARDGLKPVQRRILYQMVEMGLRPDRGRGRGGEDGADHVALRHPAGEGASVTGTGAEVRRAEPVDEDDDGRRRGRQAEDVRRSGDRCERGAEDRGEPRGSVGGHR